MRDEDRTEYGMRLRQAREHAQLRQVDLAKLAGISQGTLADLENRGSSSKFTTQLALACGVRPQWLATGDGPMVGSSDWPFSPDLFTPVNSLSTLELARLEGVLRAYLGLSPVSSDKLMTGAETGQSRSRTVPLGRFPGEVDLHAGQEMGVVVNASHRPGKPQKKRGR